MEVEAEVFLGEIAAHLPDRFGIVDDEGLRRGLAVERCEQPLHVEGGRARGDLVRVRRVVGLEVLRPLELALDLLGDQRVIGQRVVKKPLLLGIGKRGEGEDAGRHIGVHREQLLAGLVLLGVIGRVGQDDVRPEHGEGVLRRLAHVGAHLNADRELDPEEQQLAGVSVEIVDRAEGEDPVQQRQHGGDPLAVAPLRVQHLLIQGDGVAHLRDVRALFARREGPEVGHQRFFHFLIDQGKAARHGPVLRDHGGFQPLPVYRLVQIVLQADRRFTHCLGSFHVKTWMSVCPYYTTFPALCKADGERLVPST